MNYKLYHLISYVHTGCCTLLEDSFLWDERYSIFTAVSETLHVSSPVCVSSQSLVNLLVTGHAVSNVWDGDRECSGMSKTVKTTYTHKLTIFT